MGVLRTGKSPVLSIGIIFFAFGIVFFFVMLMTQRGVKVAATIEAIKEKSEIDSLGRITSTYYAQLWYKTQSDDTLRGSISTSEKYKYEIGQQIDIVYKHDNPNVFYRAKSFLWYVVFCAITLIGIGIIYISSQMKSETWDD